MIIVLIALSVVGVLIWLQRWAILEAIANATEWAMSLFE